MSDATHRPRDVRAGAADGPVSSWRGENVYGHRKRLRWIERHLPPAGAVVELGCGTGYMITLPLLEAGFDAYGVDTDSVSVQFGQTLLGRAGQDPERLFAGDLRDFPVAPEVIIASEVLEHVPECDAPGLLALLHDRLPRDGLLLVTVPNGYGCFEMESWLWFRAGLGRLLEAIGLVRVVTGIKRLALGRGIEPEYASSLAASPHVRRFTMRSITREISAQGFDVEETTGTTVFAGPFSNLFLTGLGPLTALNDALGGLVPALASGFLVAARRRECEVGPHAGT